VQIYETLFSTRPDVKDQDPSVIWPYRLNHHAKADTVRLLIMHGADVTARNKTHSTPLHLASFNGSAETVRLLIKSGADVTAQNENHSTPLHLVSSWVRTTATNSIAGLM
jgi:ankyrin repeat protein